MGLAPVRWRGRHFFVRAVPTTAGGGKIARNALAVGWVGAIRSRFRRLHTQFRLAWEGPNVQSPVLMFAQELLSISTRGRGFTDLTSQVAAVVRAAGVRTGLCSLFLRHTSASLVIQENADPAVLRDLQRWIDDAAPERPSFGPWEHDDEGPDDMPAHAKSAVTKTSETIPVTAGALALGTWQAIYLWEHRARPHRRSLVVHVAGE